MSYPLELVDGHMIIKPSSRRETKEMPLFEGKDLDPDTWSTQHGPPSTAQSAKFSDEDEDERIRRRTASMGRHTVFGHVGRSGNTTADTTDDEFITKCISNVSSAGSSISWAEDAVEAELTKNIFLLWEDIQRVCTGEVEEKLEGMTSVVYDECLSWRRAFPIQDLSRFSRFTEGNSTPTPTQDQNGGFFLGTSIYQTHSPESPNPYCLTPIMENHSSVDLWLSDCQSQDVLNNDYSQLDANRKFSFVQRVASPLTRHHIPSSQTLHLGRHQKSERAVPDPNNFFASLALENATESAERMSSPDSYNRRHSDMRVQRPVSSSTRGHLITPIPTRDRQLSRSFRETGYHTQDYDSDAQGNESFDQPSSFSNGNRLVLATGKRRPAQFLPPSHEHSHIRGSAPIPNSNHKAPHGSGLGTAHSSGSRLKNSAASPSSNSSTASSTKVSDNGAASRYSSGVSSHTPNWSRHSSITEAYSFQVTQNGTSTTKTVDSQFYETVVHDSIYQAQPNITLSRPDFLPTPRDAEYRQARAKPVRPFLYWLLDKVSPS